MRKRLIAISVTLLMAVGVGFWPGPAHADPSLVGWTAQSDANPFDFVMDSAGGLGGFHPLVEADIPEDSSDFESGPFGTGIASIFWPGSAAGNAGSLLGEAGLPSQLAPLTSKLNDPIRAQSFYPEGPTTASYPSSSTGGVAEMKSHADGNGVWAKAGLTDVSVPGLFAIQGVQGSTTATATSQARSTASGSFSSLSFLGGLVQIGSSTSTASATSDGVSPSGTATTHIGAITIAGHSVSMGSDGLVVGPAQAPQLGQGLAAPVGLVNQIISIFNLKITPLPQTQTSQAPAEEIKSGGLQVSFAIPPSASLSIDCSILPAQLAQLGIVCHLPDVLQGATFTATIARVTATAIATPPFANPPAGPLPSLGSTQGAPAASGAVPAVPSSGSSAYSSGAGNTQLAATTPQVAGTPSSGATPSGSRPLSLITLSSPVKAGLIGWLLVVALIMGAGLRRLGLFLEDAPPTACPLEGEE